MSRHRCRQMTMRAHFSVEAGSLRSLPHQRLGIHTPAVSPSWPERHSASACRRLSWRAQSRRWRHLGSGTQGSKTLDRCAREHKSKSQQWTTSWHLHSAERTSSLALDSRRRADPPRLGRLGLGRARAHEEGCECLGAKPRKADEGNRWLNPLGFR